MAYRPDTDDPLATGEKTPSLSWKALPLDTMFTLEVLEPAQSIQSRNYDTNQPDYWDDEKTRPKMSAVIKVRVIDGPHSVGEERSIWAKIPSDLFAALKAAQDDATKPLKEAAKAQGASAAEIKAITGRMAPGGTLYIKLVGETPHKNPRNNPIKNYAAKYVPGAAATKPDPFAGQAAPQPGPGAPATPRLAFMGPASADQRGSGYATPATTTTAPKKGW